MQKWSRRIPFKVDVAGVIQIMGTSLYSRPDAPIRELIQNAHDAIMRRRQRELTYQGRIDIVQDAEHHTLQFHDDGIGLSPDEAERYLGTLGIGLTGLIKRDHPAADQTVSGGDGSLLIGQFGIGLFSAFMLADRLQVESRRLDCPEGVYWMAGDGTDIELAHSAREAPGTTVTLYLKTAHQFLAEQPDALEAAVKEYADFLLIPIHINHSPTRTNVINVAWFDPTPDREAVELALAECFHESPLDVISVRTERPVPIAGALYVTSARVPGFSGEPLVTTTVRRMVVSRRIQGLLPEWASFLRGVLELQECAPTASREDLVRDGTFQRVRQTLAEHLYRHFEQLAATDRPRWEAILSWHRYTWAGAALSDQRLRELLRTTYKFPTSHGSLTFAEIYPRCQANPLVETEFDRVVWYNTDRRQESWISSLFRGHDAPCVHTLRSFEESLLAALVGDAMETGDTVDLRYTSPSTAAFAASILGVTGLEDAPPEWQEYLGASEAKVLSAVFQTDQPVLAFLNDRHELLKAYQELKQQGTVPSGFQRLIDAHFDEQDAAQNEVLINRGHPLVDRALTQRIGTPLSSVLRLLVFQALNAAGAAVSRQAQRQQVEDLDWIAQSLWGRS